MKQKLNRYLTVACLLLACVQAWGLTNVETKTIYDALPGLLAVPTPGDPVMTGFALADLDDDDVADLVLESFDRTVYRAYSTARGMTPIVLTGDMIANLRQWHGFTPVHYMNELIPEPDYTLSQRPLLASADMANNRYIALVEGETNDDFCPPETYTHMVFKPHVGDVRFVKSELSMDSERQYCRFLFYSLADPSFSKKMFRGYKDEEIMSMIVTDEFLTTHIPLQYSRWKSPEPIRSIGEGYKQVVEEFFERKVTRSRWLASCPGEVNVRDYYVVTFDTRDENVCSAFVCVAEGAVQSFTVIEGYLEGGTETYYGASVDDFYDEHLPEIMAIMDGPMGLELYVRYNSMEGTHYCVWREVGTALISVINEYSYWNQFD